MKQILLAAFLVFLPVTVSAEEYTKEDFAFGYVLKTDDQGAIYSVPLPHEVYAGTVMGDLEDIRVFNNEGQIVPHELRYPTFTSDQPKVRVAVPFFPLFSQTDQNDTELSMRIETGNNGEIINIKKNSEASTETPSAYLIDMKDAGAYPLSLNIQWTAGGTGILLPVILESSEDLISWRIIKNSTLADLVFMNNRLQHGEIELQHKSGRYLRLKPENKEDLPEITAIQTISSPESKEIERRWIELPLVLKQEKNTTYLQTGIAGGLPVDSLTIVFSQPNSLLKARVASLDGQKSWRYRGEGLFYLLTNNGNELRNEPLYIKRQNISALRLEIVEDGVGGALQSTKVQVGYVPQELLFIARGRGPFTLAYGNGSIEKSTLGNKGAFFRGLTENEQHNLLRKAEVQEKVILGGKKQLEIPSPKPWKKIILWLVLLAGVATLAVMAWSLTRKMNK